MAQPAAHGVGHLLGIMNGFRQSKALFVLVQLSVPDILQTRGALTADEVAAATSTSPSGMHRLLATACSMGILSEAQGRFQNTPLAAQYLVDGSETSLCGYIRHSDELLYPLWSGLQESVRTGECCWRHVGGQSAAEAWAATYRTDDDKLRFMRAMHSLAALSSCAVASAVDLSGCATLVDLGGATGALAAELCSRHRQLSATVVDLPEIVSLAQDHFSGSPYIQDADVRRRVRWLAADFFQDAGAVPAADAFLLARILHDWDLDRVEAILATVFGKLRPGGRIVVCEMLLDDDGLGPPAALLQSLNMLVGWHGQERTPQQYEALLLAAGFVDVVAHRTGSYLDVIEASKPHGVPANAGSMVEGK